MNDKALKTSVYVNDTVFCDSSEVAIDVDFTLPDFCPDISKIFKCKAVPRISSKGINGKNINIDGSICLTLLYCDKDGKIASYEYQYPFAKTLEMTEECASANIKCKIRTEYINCRAVTSRKVDIHGAAGISIKVFKRKCTEIISDFNDDNVELKRGIAPATVPMGFAEKYLIIEEEIKIGDGQPTIKNILRFDANSTVKETKIVKDKAVVKGEVAVNILYCSESNKTPQCVKTVLPFSQIIDVAGITEECTCDTKSEIAFIDVKPRTSVSGENKSFSLTSKILLTCEGYCSNDIAVILDAFSRKYKSEIKQNNVCFQKIIHNISEVYHCKKNIEMEEEVTSVIDLWCNVQSSTTRFEKGDMLICGTVIVGMIVCNSSSDAIYCEKPIEFEYKYPLGCELCTPYSEPQLEILSCSYTLTSSNNAEVRIELGINAAIYEKREISLISDMSVNCEQTIECKSKAALTVYFCSEGDCVWDIARNYNASVDEILKINSLEKEELGEGRMILVPML